MGLRLLSANNVNQVSVEALGLDTNKYDLCAVEAIACSLRRAAGFLCPCSNRTIIHAVVNPFRGLVSDLDKIQQTVEDTLEVLVAHGDLLELPDISQEEINSQRVLLYLGPPVYVQRQSGAIILLGVLPDNISLLPEEIVKRVECFNHVRILQPKPGEEIKGKLKELGYSELTTSAWLKAPNAETPAEHLVRMNRLMDVSLPAGEIPGLYLLEPGTSVLYYRKRWVGPRLKTGRFVGRRNQVYGNDLWCYVQLRDGNPERLIDFPFQETRWRGCDEAWHLQMAIDAQRGNPQQFRIRRGPRGNILLELYSPIPMWARRRLDTVGKPDTNPECLFAYTIPETEIEEEVKFVREALWLEELH